MSGFQKDPKGADDEAVRLLQTLRRTPLGELEVGRQVVVTGCLGAAEPLTAPHARVPVAWYRYERRARPPAGAPDRREIRRGYEALSETEVEAAPAYLEADGVRVALNLNQAQVEPTELGGGGREDGEFKALRVGLEPQGVRWLDQVDGLPVGAEVTVLGTVYENSRGALQLGPPQGQPTPFLVSAKPLEQLVARQRLRAEAEGEEIAPWARAVVTFGGPLVMLLVVVAIVMLEFPMD